MIRTCPELTTFELARILGVSARQLLRLANDGRLPAVRRTPGGWWRFRLGDVAEALRSSGCALPPTLLDLLADDHPEEET